MEICSSDDKINCHTVNRSTQTQLIEIVLREMMTVAWTMPLTYINH